MQKYLLLLLLTISLSAQAQTYIQLLQKANTAYKAKDYPTAATFYLKANNAAEFDAVKPECLYNAACCYALTGDTALAFSYLHQAIKQGFCHISDIASDSDLSSLHASPQWKGILAIKPRVAATGDPLKARLVTSDIGHFWDAYDRAQKDTANRYAIYKKYYIDRGSPGMQDYFGIKVRSLTGFVAVHNRLAKFYAAIRKNTYAVNQQKPKMQSGFIKLKKLYPQAKFPDVYFIIGNFTSGGTSTDDGLLIGLDQSVRTSDIPTGELSMWENNNFHSLDQLPHMVAHELIHFQQNDMGADSTLLKAVLVEGMADFLGMLISGKTANERLHTFAKGHEKQIWADFKKEMYLNRAQNWIANASQETPTHPADLGYWVGYQVCKAYYDQSNNKKQAVYNMLHIQNYRRFYEQSRVEERIALLH